MQKIQTQHSRIDISIFCFCGFETMLADSAQIGATTQGTTFADIIINNVSSVAEGAIQGFAQFVHDPKALKATVGLFSKTATPKKFADAVVLRRIETQKLDDIWNFPLNMAVPTTCPIPWTVVESTCRSQQMGISYEFNIMRTVDFVGRNYIRLVLPAVDTSNVVDSFIQTNPNLMLALPGHTYLGAWQRDLIPRIIERVEFYPRSNAHKLFEYSGYDIFVHNILFGNAHKEMNDLMAGEDKFELCYDPYRVDGSALGMASFQGVDTSERIVQFQGNTPSIQAQFTPEQTSGTQIYSFANLLLDTQMSDEQFKTAYRHNVWYEAPIAQNYHARHSIHSRRMFHQKKDITIPLDILPFGYSIASSLPSAALSGECGFIKITIFNDWFDRAFYLTKVSDIPSLHPIINHRHYNAGDWVADGATTIVAQDSDGLLGWVNMRSLGHFGDPQWKVKPETIGTAAPESEVSDQTVLTEGGTWGYTLQAQPFSQPNAILGVPDANKREGIIPTPLNFNAAGQFITTSQGLNSYGTSGESASASAAMGLLNIGAVNGINRNPTLYTIARADAATEGLRSTDLQFIHKMSYIDASKYASLTQQLGVKLLQVGYQTLPCIREFLSKLPNIYITTEWDDKDYNIGVTNFDINNDLYIQGIVLWFVPKDNEGIESMRVYPCHLLDHEYPLIAGMQLVNEQSQGTTIYDWSMLNVFNPAQMGMNPLIENMGLLSFSPTLTSNTLPLAYYDSNINGYLKAKFLQGEGSVLQAGGVNLKNGTFKVISIGVNGVANVNLNLFRLVF